jgi:pimeloyl-ACP methyl ester carboxylesterase
MAFFWMINLVNKIASILFITCVCAIFFSPSLVAAQNILFSDNFNDGNLDGWTIQNGSWFINSNHLVGSLNGTLLEGKLILDNHSEWDNYAIDLDINNQSGVDEGIGFRRTEPSRYEFNLRHGTGIFDTPEIKLFKVINNNANLIYSTHNISLVNNRFYHIRIEAEGEVLRLFLDGVKVIEYQDPNTQIKKGTISLSTNSGAFGSDFVRFDNLVVTSLGPSKTPLIFIPGIGGSEFKTKALTNWSAPDGHGGTFTHNYPLGEKVWVNTAEAVKPGNDDYFDILRLKLDGQTEEAPLELTDTLADPYQETINFFNSNGYTLNQDFFIFPYDWRKDLSLTGPLLDQKVTQILATTGATKVDIVAHSMGGLVARNYIKGPAKAIKVRKLIELGTPHLGSAKFINTLRYGDCLYLKVVSICLTLAPSELKDVLQNSIGAYQLSPTQKYFSFYDGSDDNHPYPLRDDVDLDNNQIKGTLNYSQTKDFLTNLNHNTTLFTPTENFHSIDDQLENTNGVDITLIAGSGLPTLGQIIEKQTTIGPLKVSKKDALMINGDNTVPLFSASLKDLERNRSLLGDAHLYFSKQIHTNLVSNGPALNLVKNILSGTNTLPSGTQNQPYAFNGQLISLHSPVNMEITDKAGNKTGIESDGTIKEEIPGSFFETIGDAKFIWLPDEGNYEIKLNATDNGNFDFKIRDFQDNINTKSVIFSNVPIISSTKAETDLNTDDIENITLKVDQDGNGTLDKEIHTPAILDGNEFSDTTSPELEAIFNLTTQSLDLLGSDNLPGAYLQDLINGDLLIQDLAGNTTKLVILSKINKAQDKSGSVTLNLLNISYDSNDEPITLPTNILTVSYKLDQKTNLLTDLKQYLIIQNQLEIKLNYDSKKDQTRIVTTEYGEEEATQIKNGLVLLKLKTKEGQLTAEY